MHHPYPEETLGVQVIWTLDNFTEQNGATYYVPGSHKLRKWPDQNDIDTKYFPKRATCEKGSLIIFFGKLWHTQGINSTDSPRSALLANFSPLYIPAKDNICEQIKSDDKMFEKDGMVRFN